MSTITDCTLVAAVAVLALTWSALSIRAGDVAAGQRYPQVRELDPVGYWPCDEGQGEVVHDRSGNDNHGTLYAVPWQDGFLHFENDVYQWIEIDHHSDYESPSFSMGGWVYSRAGWSNKSRRFYIRRTAHNRVLMIGQPFTPRTHKDGAFGWMHGRIDESTGAMLRFGPPPDDSPAPSLIEVVSGGQKDATGSVEEQVELSTGEWQHVLYTYERSGTGRLYLNGHLAHSADDVPYSTADTPFAIGAGGWAVPHQGGTVSLDGSVRDMVLFDRALSAEDVRHLYEATRPEEKPSPPESSGENASDVSGDMKELIAQVRNREREEADRAEAALALAEMGEDAADAVPALRTVLEDITEREGTHVPRIEDLLRNAVMRALLDIAPEEESVRNLLGKTLAKPVLETLGSLEPYPDEIRRLVDKDRYMDALEAHRAHLETVPKLPRLPRMPTHDAWESAYPDKKFDALLDRFPLREEYFDAYLSTGLPFRDAHWSGPWSQVDIHNGTAYIPMVERVPREEVKTIYENTLKNHAEEKPDPEGKWSRLQILKITANGSKRESFLGGPWMMFDARDAKMDGWSVLIDGDEYVHLIGGQHNYPKRKHWIPGSWEKFGIDQPKVMYWVSEKPLTIDSFEFVGGKDNPRSFSGWMNYMQFARSPDGTPFLYGRGRRWSWGMLRYDTAERRWTELKGRVSEMMKSARRKNPEWYEDLGGKVQYHGPGDGLVAAYQPYFYNYNRQRGGLIKGVAFDKTGRMHVKMGIFGVGKGGKMTSGPVYAYSDDLGETFHRADGTPLELPLTVNPIPGHDANMRHHSTKQWYDLWISLIQEAGWKRKGGFDR